MKEDNVIGDAVDAYVKKKGLQDNIEAQVAYLAGWLDGEQHGRTRKVLIDVRPANSDEVINER